MPSAALLPMPTDWQRGLAIVAPPDDAVEFLDYRDGVIEYGVPLRRTARSRSSR